MRRARARVMLRAFEAVTPDRFHKARASQGSPDVSPGLGTEALRTLARDIDENNDIGAGVLNILTARIIGRGIQTEPMVRRRDGTLHTEFNNEIRKLIKDWSRRPEVTKEYNVGKMQRLMCRSWLRDGEVLGKMLSGPIAGLNHGTKVPFSVELIEADLLPFHMIQQGRRIIHGVEKNAWSQPVGYHLLKDYADGVVIPGMNISSIFDTVRVSAADIVHLKMTKRIRQTRGVSIFAAVFRRLDDLKEYEDSERIAARVAAAMTLYIKKSDQIPGAAVADPTQTFRDFELAPGNVFDNLLPGEEVGVVQSNRPSNQLGPFREANLRAVSASTEASYSSISKDRSGSYSSQRQELVEDREAYEALRDEFVSVAWRPIIDRMLQTALMSGVLRMPSDVDIDTMYDADYRGPAMPWIDPGKEANAEVTLINAGLKSRSQSIRDRGGDPTQVFAEIEQEKEQFGTTDIAPDTSTDQGAGDSTVASDGENA